MQTHAKFYALLHQMPGASKDEIVRQYHPNGSLSELFSGNGRQYARMLQDMERAVSGQFSAEADAWRKRVISSISSHFTRQGRYVELQPRERLEIIKATAVRIAKVEHFNKIPLADLRKIYNTFRSK